MARGSNREAENPYHPAEGMAPAFLAGRDGELKLFREALDDFPGIPADLWVTGLRGTGKTVLLGKFEEIATVRGWVSVRRDWDPVEDWNDRDTVIAALDYDFDLATKHLSVLQRMKAAGRTAVKRGRELATVEIAGVSWSLAGEISEKRLLSDWVKDAVLRLGTNAKKAEHGVVLFYDEAQLLPLKPLHAIIAGVLEAQQKQLPVMLVLCGLPPLVDSSHKARSNAIRNFREPLEIGNLPTSGDPSLAYLALTKPVEDLPISYDPETARQIVEDVSGYPFFIQLAGAELWKAATQLKKKEVDAELYEATKPSIWTMLDKKFYGPIYRSAQVSEQNVLRMSAASVQGERFRPQDFVSLYPKSRNALDQTLKRLKDEVGLIYSTGAQRGEYGYTIPLFGDYLRRVHTWGPSEET